MSRSEPRTSVHYARRHLAVWTASEDRLASVNDIRACVTHDGPLEPRSGVSYVAGLDLGVKRDATVLAVCHAEGSGTDRRIIVDRIEAWEPTREQPVDLAIVEDTVREAARRYRGHVVADPWQSLLLCRNLRARGVRVTEFPFTAQSVGRIAHTLFNLIRDHRIAFPDEGALLDELANIRLRQTSPGVLRLDHDPDRHDDRAVAVALAAHELAGKAQGGPASVSRLRDRPIGHPKPGARAVPKSGVWTLRAR